MENEVTKLFDEYEYLPGYTFPGAYPIFYLDKHNSILCAKCALESLNDDIHEFRASNYGIHYEGESLFCEECNYEIESAYGVPE